MRISTGPRVSGKGRKFQANEGGKTVSAKSRTGSEGAEASRATLYDEVTARIIGELEAGRFPWVQPWGQPDADGRALGPGLPRNALTARRYSGVNVLILWGAVIEHGYPSQGWLTFKQALEAGGCVRKGERGTTVVYADRFTPEAEKARARDEGGEARAIPFLKRFTVFNVAQCEGLRAGPSAEPTPLPEREIVPVAEQVIAASGIDFRVGGNRAFYVPALDYVQVPPQPAFFEQINYYRTCLHELTHATGHASRLARNLTTGFGTKDYAREELVAEMGSAFLCAALGIVPTVRHADYLANWLDVLREDNRAIFRAASAASKAADWLLAKHAAAQVEAVRGEAVRVEATHEDTGERPAPQDGRLAA
ncbi:ArdC family protein [Novosphingobium colocasiae]|uniref:ArdC family protein n=1 Tax=Novosphingobium colocasiae TaxID=1256513 RepID=UPI0035B4F026